MEQHINYLKTSEKHNNKSIARICLINLLE